MEKKNKCLQALIAIALLGLNVSGSYALLPDSVDYVHVPQRQVISAVPTEATYGGVLVSGATQELILVGMYMGTATAVTDSFACIAGTTTVRSLTLNPLDNLGPVLVSSASNVQGQNTGLGVSWEPKGGIKSKTGIICRVSNAATKGIVTYIVP